jgi:putative hydrolase of the HAD superfamily
LDADNTLWDTNAVFRRAGDRMIEVLDHAAGRLDKKGASESRSASTKKGPHNDTAGSDNKEFLYRLSRHLPSMEAGSFNLVQLARAAAFYRSSLQPETGEGQPTGDVTPGPATDLDPEEARARWAARQARSDRPPPQLDPAHIQNAAQAFRAVLSATPPLLNGTRSLLDAVQNWRAARPGRRTSVLFSEGEPDRLSVAFEAYHVGEGRYFDDIVLRKKTPRTFQEVCTAIERAVDRRDPPAAGIVVVGDSLQRDIRPANAVGCTTVYCPGDLWGREQPEGPEEEPDYRVDRVDEVISLFDLGRSPGL